MWISIANIILKYRVLILVLLVIITGFMFYKMRQVTYSYKYSHILPAKDPAYVDYKKFKSLFKENNNSIIIGIDDTNFFELDKLLSFQYLVDSLNTIKGVDTIVYIGTIVNLKKDTNSHKFKFVKTLEHLPKTEKELKAFKQDLKNMPLYQGVIFNDSIDKHIMIVTLNKYMLESKEREKLIDDILNITNEFFEEYSVKHHYSGLPYIRIMTARMVKRELNFFIFLALLITSLIIYWFFRSFKIVFLSLIVVGVSVVWAMGTLALFDYKINLLTGIVPTLLIVIGMPNFIFLLNKYHNEYQQHRNKIKALQRVIIKIGKAIFLTNATTASGFVVFTVTSSDILREFGTIASINIMGIFLLSLILVPIVFSLAPAPKKKEIVHLDNKYIYWVIEKIIKIILNHKVKVYLLTFLIFSITIVGILKIKTTGYLVDDIPHNDKTYTDFKFFENHFSGIIPLEILIDTKKNNKAMSLGSLKYIDKFTKKLAEIPELSRPISLIDAYKFLTQAYYNGAKKHYRLPTRNELLFINKYLPDDTTSIVVSNMFVDSAKQISRIRYHVADIGTYKMSDLYDRISTIVQSVFPKEKYDVSITGESILFFKGTKYLTRNLLISLSIAVVLISLFMALLLSSKRMIIIALVANILPLIIIAGIMGFFDIPIKVSTILVFSIAFGISVDDTIHFLAKYKEELKETNFSVNASVIIALRETGVSMIYTSIILFFGFGVFIISEFGGTTILGILVAITIFFALFSNLLFLPSLIVTFNKNKNKNK